MGGRLHSFLLAALFPVVVFADVFSLSDLQWSLSSQNGSVVVPGSVPSQVHLDLLRAGVITEPLLETNDFDQRWIIYDNWTYTADVSPFTQSVSKNSSDKTLLVFYGVDTIANITLAGHTVAWVNNEFQQYVFDVSDLLSSPLGNSTNLTNNEFQQYVFDVSDLLSPPLGNSTNLTIAFESAWYYGVNVTSRPDAESTPFSDLLDFEIPGIRNWIRKVQSDFGWDWGPAFVPAGVHKPAYFITLSDNNASSTTSNLASPSSSSQSRRSLSDAIKSPILISESSIDIYKQGYSAASQNNLDETAPWVLNISLGIHSAVEISSPSLTFTIPELKYASDPISLATIPALGSNGSSVVSTPTWVVATSTIDDSLPQRWFPHNLGTPKLYNLTITLDLGIGSDNITFTTPIGFRTIRLVQTRYPDDEVAQRGITPGDQWHFEVNGKAFYALGTNVIPFDPFYARVTDEQVRWVLESAVASGQNMLRVWGGGLYQPSSSSAAITPNYPPHSTDTYSFYAICDELGIMAWSEFIFSDDLYPINDWILDSVNVEVRQNVRRINKHASNVQWAGSNEIEEGAQLVNATVSNGLHYLNEFVTLFQDYLHDIAYAETNSVPYTDCSTTHGVLSLDPLVLRFGNGTPGEIYGNSERYNYDASQAFDYDTFPVSRFVNEFGFHSMPSFYSWEEALTNPDDFSFNSPVVMSRDHHPPAGGLAFPNPNANQGQTQMSSAVELWLPTPGTSDSNQTFAQWCYSTQVFQAMTMGSQIAWYRQGAGRGENNLGALVWQLNDIWQGVSWSAIEYSGRWKVLQYTLADIFAPVVINPFWTAQNESLEIVVTSDRWEDASGLAQWTWFDWQGNALHATQKNFTVPALNNSVLFSAQGLTNILPSGKNAAEVWLLLNLTAEVDGRTVTNEQYFTPTSLAHATLVDPQIRMTSNSSRPTFTLSARGGVAPWTWLDHPAGTVGYFVDAVTGQPSNAFYLVPGQDRTVTFKAHPLSKNLSLDVNEFVVRSLWNNTHV